MTDDPHPSTLPATPWRTTLLVLLPVCIAKLLLHGVCLTEYGYFRDELYYLASLRHLDLGYVEHPPLFIYLLAAWTSLWGESLAAVRSLAVLAGTAHVAVVGLMVRSLGGRSLAQGLAAVAVAFMPIYLGTQHLYTMNVFDQLLWALVGLACIPLFRDGEPRHWILLGCLLGLGLMNKISVLWLGAGIGVAVLVTRRKSLLTRWPWIAAATAFLFLLPYLFWQAAHGFPLLEFMRNAAERKMQQVGIGDFLLGQVLVTNPFALPLFVAGIVGLLALRTLRPAAWAGMIALTVAVILIAAGNSKSYYMAGAYPFLLVPGAIALERLCERGWRLRMGWAYAGTIAATGLLMAPFAIPLLPVEQYIRYASAVGVTPPADERMRLGPLPQGFADMFGWEGFVAEIARAYQALGPEDRARCAIVVKNYGEAGAIDLFGPRYGLPRAISGHNTYWIWGPGSATGEVILMVGGKGEEEREWFASVEVVGRTPDHPYAMPYERNRTILLCRGLKIPMRQAWERAKEFL
jgi:hypothetical protein